MNTYITINPSTAIGNSLSSININYLNLEKDFFTEKLSADRFWSVMSDYYISLSPFLKSAVSVSQGNSSIFLGSCTTVESNSAGWLKPITIFYPSLFPDSTSPNTILTTLSSWVNYYFPTIDVNTSSPNYVEDQVAIIYAHTWQYGLSIDENQYLKDSTTCRTSDKRICAYCTDRYYGGTWCGTNSWADCGGRGNSCQQCADLSCYYNSPPYPLLGSNKLALGFISANVSMSFKDRNELDRINAIVFKIKNCSWVYDRNIINR